MYLNKVQIFTLALKYFDIFYIPRKENAHADMLSQLETSIDNSLNRTYIKHPKELIVDET